VKEIILIRHGRVDVNADDKIKAKDLEQWVKAYDVAKLDVSSQPSEEVHRLVNQADFLLTSALSRAIESASKFEREIDKKNVAFNELSLPKISIPYFEFKAKTWLIILRLVLFFAKNDKKYVENALRQLLQHSKEHKLVVLIGHGGLNYYLHKALLKEGWSLVEKPSHKNWGLTKLYKE
jgi:broad specificity phosphatase PhoE